MSLKEIYENNPDHYIQGGEIYDILTTTKKFRNVKWFREMRNIIHDKHTKFPYMSTSGFYKGEEEIDLYHYTMALYVMLKYRPDLAYPLILKYISMLGNPDIVAEDIHNTLNNIYLEIDDIPKSYEYIYICVNGSSNYYKVGRTSNSVLLRINQLQVGNPNKISLYKLYKTKSSVNVEKYIHRYNMH